MNDKVDETTYLPRIKLNMPESKLKLQAEVKYLERETDLILPVAKLLLLIRATLGDPRLDQKT